MQTKNPMLAQIEQQTEAKVPADLKPTFERIVAAGQKVMYSPQTHKMMTDQMAQGEPAHAAGEGIAKLFGILMHESKGTLNMKAAIPAMTSLLCEALDFMEQAGKVQITPDVIAKATQEMASSIMQMLGVTPEKLQGMMGKGQTAQPAQQPSQPAQMPGIIQGAA